MAKSKSSETTAKKNKSNQNSNDDSENSSAQNNGNVEALEALLEEGLRDIYSVEQQLIKALPEMADAAYSEELEEAFRDHLKQTERQAERLEKVFGLLEVDAEEEHCEVMEKLIEAGNKIVDEYEEGPVRDAALIIAAQKVEHYEIASYGSLRELADVLGYDKIYELLERSMEEEKFTDEELTFIAQDINDEAAELSGQEEGELEEVY